MKLERVEVLNSSGDYKRLKAIDQSEIDQALTEFKETNGMPTHYDVVGDSVFLYPKPAAADVTTAAGLKLHFLREIDVFTTSDTTQQPGFAEPFHRILSHGASYDWMLTHSTPNKAKSIRGEIELMRQDLEAFYKDRNRDVKISVKPAHTTEQYV